MIIKKIVLVALVAAVVFASPAFAGPWTFNATGSNARFGWSGGQHVALPGGSAHGSPVVSQDGFFFVDYYGDMNFRAEVGGVQTVNAGVSVRVTPANSTPPGAPPIDLIIVREYGTWGGNLSDIQAQADFDITEYVTGYANNTGTLTFTPATFNPDGTWTAERTFVPGPGNPLGAPWTNPNILADFKIRVRNLVGVQGSVAGTFIEKKGLQIIVPEPGALLLLAVALPVAFRRVGRR
jgi:hypothetical protein